MTVMPQLRSTCEAPRELIWVLLPLLITLCESIAKIKLSEPRPHSIEFR